MLPPHGGGGGGGSYEGGMWVLGGKTEPFSVGKFGHVCGCVGYLWRR